MRAFAALGIIYYGPDSSLAQGFVHRVRFCRAHLTACARALPRSARGYGQNSAKSCRMRTISRLPAEDIYPQAPRRSVRCLRPGSRRTRPAERFKSAQLGAVVARRGQLDYGHGLRIPRAWSSCSRDPQPVTMEELTPARKAAPKSLGERFWPPFLRSFPAPEM